MASYRALFAVIGGLVMIAAFFMPWAKASIMGFSEPILSGYDLAQKETVWLAPPVCGGLAAVGGLAALLLARRKKFANGRRLGLAVFVTAAAPGVFLLAMLARLHGGGIAFSWLENATAESLGLRYLYGLHLEFLGCLMAAVGGAWLAAERR